MTAFAETDDECNEYTEVTEGSLIYRVYADHAELSECVKSSEGKIVIPDKINGVSVTSIGEKAFYYCKKLTGITIPDSVTSIGYALLEYLFFIFSKN